MRRLSCVLLSLLLSQLIPPAPERGMETVFTQAELLPADRKR